VRAGQAHWEGADPTDRGASTRRPIGQPDQGLDTHHRPHRPAQPHAATQNRRAHTASEVAPPANRRHGTSPRPTRGRATSSTRADAGAAPSRGRPHDLTTALTDGAPTETAERQDITVQNTTRTAATRNCPNPAPRTGQHRGLNEPRPGDQTPRAIWTPRQTTKRPETAQNAESRGTSLKEWAAAIDTAQAPSTSRSRNPQRAAPGQPATKGTSAQPVGYANRKAQHARPQRRRQPARRRGAQERARAAIRPPQRQRHGSATAGRATGSSVAT